MTFSVAHLLHQLLRLLPDVVYSARVLLMLAVGVHHCQDALGVVDAFYSVLEAFLAAGVVGVEWVHEAPPLILDPAQNLFLLWLQTEKLIVSPVMDGRLRHGGVHLERVVEVPLEQLLVAPDVVDVRRVLRFSII